jgi:Mce-associated membrane protein
MNRAPTSDAGPEEGTMTRVTADDTRDDAVTDAGVGDDAVVDDAAGGEPASRGRGGRLSIPLVPTLSVLLVLLLGAVAFLWFTRPEATTIRTDVYAQALQAARSNIVDLTSYDHLTFDDDVEQIRRVTTGDLRDETVAELEAQREVIVDGGVVVNSEVIDAGVTRATDDTATVLLFIQATQTAEGSEESQVRRYPIEVDLVKQDDGRWLLSGIRGRDL